MDGKVSINAATLAKSAEVSQLADGSTKKPQVSSIVEGIKLPLVYNERLAEILHSFGLKASEENMSILRLLYENGFPLTKENFFKMNHALKLTGSNDKALFMYENNMKMTAANLAILDGIVGGKIKITHQLAGLSEAISEVKDPAVKAKLTEVFAREKEVLEELLPKEKNPAAQTGKQAAPVNVTPVSVEKLTAQAAAHHINIAHLGKFMPARAEITASAEITARAETAAGVKLSEGETVPAAKEGTATTKDIRTLPTMPLGEGKAPVVKHVSFESITGEAKPLVQREAAIKPTSEAANSAAVKLALPASHEQSTMAQASPATVENVSAQEPMKILPKASESANRPQPVQTSGRPSFNNLLFSPAQRNPLEISRYIESLRSRLVEIIQTLRDSPDPASNRVVQAAREILNHIDFSAQIRNQIYVQLPYVMGDGQTDVSLYVFKDANKTSASDGRGISSAFLSLETASLGLFEAYVQKKDNSIHLQFRLKNEKTIDLVRENISRLDTLMGEHNLSLASYKFTKNDEAFTVLDKPEKLSDESPAALMAGDEIPQFDELA